MLIVRTIGFAFSLTTVIYTQKICACGAASTHHELFDDVRSCVTDSRSWFFVAVRILLVTMACDVLFPMLTLILVMRKRIRRCYRAVRPPKERNVEEVQMSYETACKCCCECSSIMTCYAFGGKNLSAGSYADVAIALTDFVAHDGFDIVASDVAAAMICLVQVQKQKQIDCKNELVKEGGIIAKDKRLATKLWRNLIDKQDTLETRQRSMVGIINSLSFGSNEKDSGDIEAGLDVNNNGKSNMLQTKSVRQALTVVEEGKLG